MTGDTKSRYSTSIQQRLENRLVDLIRKTIRDEMPAVHDKSQKIWDVEVSYHGENYGMDTFVDSVIAGADRQQAVLYAAMGDQAGDFTLEAIQKNEEYPPKLILRIHFWKRSLT